MTSRYRTGDFVIFYYKINQDKAEKEFREATGENLDNSVFPKSWKLVTSGKDSPMQFGSVVQAEQYLETIAHINTAYVICSWEMEKDVSIIANSTRLEEVDEL